MSFLGNIFKKKPGGTFVGNLIRGAASSVSGGILGKGTMLKQWEQSPEGQAAIAAQNNTVPTGQPSALALAGQNLGLNALAGALGTPEGKSLVKQGFKAWLQANKWAYAVGGGIVLGLLFLVKKAFSGPVRGRRR